MTSARAGGEPLGDWSADRKCSVRGMYPTFGTNPKCYHVRFLTAISGKTDGIQTSRKY